MIRIGHGYDVHLLTEGRKLILGGINIPYEKGLLGHSDADVLTHSVMDAILGALAKPDIGHRFPDNDPKFKDADSIELLHDVVSEMVSTGYSVGNIDCTIIAEKPMLKPYIDDIRACLSMALGTDIGNVNVKATTEEGLGLAGNGIGAHAVCILISDDSFVKM